MCDWFGNKKLPRGNGKENMENIIALSVEELFEKVIEQEERIQKIEELLDIKTEDSLT